MTDSTRKAKLPIVKAFTMAGAAIATATPSADADGISFTFSNGNSVGVSLSGFRDYMVQLALYGLRSQLNLALQQCKTEAEAESAIKSKIADLQNGKFSDRTGERGYQLSRVAAIVASIKSKDAADVLVSLKSKEASLSEGDFKAFITALRGTPSYKETQRRLFPDSSKRGRKAKAKPADLFADL